MTLWQPFLAAPRFRELQSRIEGEKKGTTLEGLVEGSRALTLALLQRTLERPIAVIVPDETALDHYLRDLSSWGIWTGSRPFRIASMPALSSDPYAGIPSHPEVMRQRVITLGRLARGEVDFLLLPAASLLRWLPSPEEWKTRTHSVRVGEDLSPEPFMLDCLSRGYQRVDTVTATGELSRRGGIVDIFPPNLDEPLRIEWFGDTIESLRPFDPDNQRSTGAMQVAVLDPASESGLGPAGLVKLKDWLTRRAQSPDRGDVSPQMILGMRDRLDNEGRLEGMESLTALTAGRPSTAFDHAAGFITVVDEPIRAEASLGTAWSDLQQVWDASEERILPPPAELFPDAVAMRDRLREADLFLQELKGDPPPYATHVIEWSTRAVPACEGSLPRIAKALGDVRDRGARCLALMRAKGGMERLAEALAEHEMPVRMLRAEQADGGEELATWGPFLGVASLARGFEFSDPPLAVFSERELFGEAQREKGPRRGSRGKAFLSDFRDLKPGDSVVHVDHGIALYEGLGRPKGGSLNRDFMSLAFAGGDRLFVPVDRLDLVQKFHGSGDDKPKLDKLGGPSWERVKAKIRKSVRSMAKELLQLYATRHNARGRSFGPDTPWQREFEDAFPFPLTRDQERVLEEIKTDLEREKPMDRLLVGDVGFGKTEVAVRAAFKAVMEGTQVAFLCPTTVLAQQHARTLRERMAAFAIRVEMISRFRTLAEVRQTLKKVSDGEVDILIGTHRLLSKDVEFRELGLLIVDEEQRFGVAHKERLKQLSHGVHALSMTATPIPRTLQMSLAGVRDLSVIQTPPSGRMAIQTFLTSYRGPLIREAIRRELRREGQVFFVHNRIDNLNAIAASVGELVPEAKILTAHGQLPERQLERVMRSFVNYEADILVTTTIVENGLDIPRANTIFVNHADRFGLSQLYQLRGRVGRSDREAYAFFIVVDRQNLSDVARKRMRALQEFSDLGAGFRLAAADLEIRGAGEMLGTRQHGHIAAIGFDLYVQMLERAVSEQKGETIRETTPPTIHLGVDIKVPESYMAEAGDRLAFYKRLAGAREEEAIDRIEQEIEDRYGHPPPTIRNLVQLTRLRLLGERIGVKSVDLIDEKLQIRFHEQPRIDHDRLLTAVRKRRGTIRPSGAFLVPAPPKATRRLQSARELLTWLSEKPQSG